MNVVRKYRVPKNGGWLGKIRDIVRDSEGAYLEDSCREVAGEMEIVVRFEEPENRTFFALHWARLEAFHVAD